MPEPAGAYERVVEFLMGIEDGTATRTEPWRWGTAFFNSNFPNKYAQNYLRIDRDDPTASAEAMAEEAHRVQGAAGLKHRRINGYGDAAARHDLRFAAMSWGVSRILVMAHDGKIRPWHRGVHVERRDFTGVRDAIIAWDQLESSNRLEISVQIADSRTALFDAAQVDFLVGVIDDDIAGWAELYRAGGIAQIESVMTFPDHRNKGVAASVVNSGLETAYAEGSELAFLLADEDDWPEKFYERLGFSVIGTITEFTIPGT